MYQENKALKWLKNALYHNSSILGTPQKALKIWSSSDDYVNPCSIRNIDIHLDPMTMVPEICDPADDWTWSDNAKATLNRFALVALFDPEPPNDYDGAVVNTRPEIRVWPPENTFDTFFDGVATANDSNNISCLITGQWRGNGWLETEYDINVGSVPYSMYIGNVVGVGTGITTTPLYVPATFNPIPSTIDFGSYPIKSRTTYGGYPGTIEFGWEGCIECNRKVELWLICHSAGHSFEGDTGFNWICDTAIHADIRASSLF